MQTISIIADVTLPGLFGAKTTDIIAIQKNILTIQQFTGKKIYAPGDIGKNSVLVVTGVGQYVCVISLALRELTGYMAFIDGQKSQAHAMSVFYALCPARADHQFDMEQRFTNTFYQVKNNAAPHTGPLLHFTGNPARRPVAVAC